MTDLDDIDLAAVAETFEELGRSVAANDPVVTLATVAEQAVARMSGARWASVTTLRYGEFRTVAATDEVARLADAVQYELGSGPCVDAIVDDAVYRPDDLRHDDRWPEFGRRVSSEFGVLSMVAYRLRVDTDDGVEDAADRGVDSLNVYADQPRALDDAAVLTGLMLATHGAVASALAANRSRVVHLEQALRSSREIGMAMGVLMAVHKVTEDQAFDLLRMASQNTNRKLRDVAVEVAERGVLPLRRQPSRRPEPSGRDQMEPSEGEGAAG